MERKSFSALEVKAVDGQPGTVEAIVSVSGNEDLGGDIVQPGAFAKFIGDVKSGTWSKWPTLLWGHGIDAGLAAVTGKVTDMSELAPGSQALPATLRAKGLGGLLVRAQYNLDTQPGREAYAHVKAGDVSDWSFAYEAPDTAMDAKGRRLLKTIYPVYEVSNVLIGMNPETVTIGVKMFKALTEEPAPDSRRAKLLPEVREILEQVEGYTQDPTTARSVANPQEKGDPTVLVGNEAFHQGVFDLAIQAITALIKQELSEGGFELDDVRWLAGIALDLRSWAQSENWDAISDAQNAAVNAVTAPAQTSSGAPTGSTSGGISLASLPATDDRPALDSPPAQRILDPYYGTSGTTPPLETKEVKVDPVEEEIDEEKIAAFAKLAVRDLLPTIDLSELIEVSKPLDVIEESDTEDGLTNWARYRVRH